MLYSRFLILGLFLILGGCKGGSNGAFESQSFNNYENSVKDTLILENSNIFFGEEGASHTLKAHWAHSDNKTTNVDLSEESYTIHTDDASVASVDALDKTKLVSKSPGVVQVWISFVDGSNVYESNRVTVWVKTGLKTLSFEKDVTNLHVGEQSSFVLIAKFSDGQSWDVTSAAKWFSSSQHIVGIEKGVAVGESVGAAEVTAEFGGSSVKKEVSVTNGIMDSLLVKPNYFSLLVNQSSIVDVSAVGTGGAHFKPESVSVTSSNESVAKMDDNGNLVGIGEGEASLTVIATQDGIELISYVEVKVSADTVKDIYIVQDDLTFAVGEQTNLSVFADYKYRGHEEITDNVEWDIQSSDSSPPISFISSDSIRADRKGDAALIARWTDNSGTIFEDEISISVDEKALEQIVIQPVKKEFTVDDEPVRVRAFGIFSDASSGEITSSVEWGMLSSGESISIAKEIDGVFIHPLIGGGSATIEASTSEVKGSVDVVVASRESVKIETTQNVVYEGLEIKVDAYAMYSNSDDWIHVTNKAHWSSSDSNLASVYEGLVKGENESTEAVVITASLGEEHSADVEIDVGPAQAEALTVAPLYDHLMVGESIEFKAVFTNSDSSLQFAPAELLKWRDDTFNDKDSVDVSSGGLVTAIKPATSVRIHAELIDATDYINEAYWYSSALELPVVTSYELVLADKVVEVGQRIDWGTILYNGNGQVLYSEKVEPDNWEDTVVETAQIDESVSGHRITSGPIDVPGSYTLKVWYKEYGITITDFITVDVVPPTSVTFSIDTSSQLHVNNVTIALEEGLNEIEDASIESVEVITREFNTVYTCTAAQYWATVSLKTYHITSRYGGVQSHYDVVKRVSQQSQAGDLVLRADSHVIDGLQCTERDNTYAAEYSAVGTNNYYTSFIRSHEGEIVYTAP